MSNQILHNLGDAIFGDIDNNPFLNELYDDILYNYAITKFNLTDKRQMREINVVSALRFADLLSKSTHAMNRDKHKMWAQEIIILLYSLYPDNPDVKFYAGSVFANTGNYQARRIIDSDFYGTTALERFFAEYQPLFQRQSRNAHGRDGEQPEYVRQRRWDGLYCPGRF